MRIWALTLFGLAGAAAAQVAMPPAVEQGLAHRPIRTTLATVPLPDAKRVTRVEMMRVDFPAGEVQQRHIHPVPVVCFVAIGRFAVQLEGQPEIAYEEGSVNVEPAGKVVEHVRNLTDRPARLYCSFLAGEKDKVLSQYLPDREEGVAPPKAGIGLP